jgi:hypothetical protein
MDALALLCTLYAEGPATLARLREDGCATIDDVLARDARDLAPILLATEATAQRFQREARNLTDRVGVEGMSDIRPAAIIPRPTGSARASRGAGSTFGNGHVRPPVLDRVLAAWRERDEHDGDLGAHVEPLETDAHDETRDHTGDSDFAREAILDPAIVVRPPAATAARKSDQIRGIAADAVDGLDAETSVALARAGVRDLHALGVCDPLIVARASGLEWTRLNRLRALARRVPGFARRIADETAGTTARDVEPAVEEKVSPSERPIVGGEARASLHRAANRSLEREPVTRPPALERAPSQPIARHAPEGAGGPFA